LIERATTIPNGSTSQARWKQRVLCILDKKNLIKFVKGQVLANT